MLTKATEESTTPFPFPELGRNWSSSVLRENATPPDVLLPMDEDEVANTLQRLYLSLALLAAYSIDCPLFLVILRSESLRQPSFVFIFAYLLTELLTTTQYSVEAIVLLTQRSYQLSSAICDFQAFLQSLAVQFSPATLTLLSLEKYYYIVEPLRHVSLFTNRKAVCYASTALFLFFVIYTLSFFHERVLFMASTLSCKMDFGYKSSAIQPLKVFADILHILLLLTLLTTPVYLNLRILKIALRQRRQVRATNMSSDGEFQLSRVKAMIPTLLIIAVYWGTWLPYLAVFFVKNVTSRRIMAYLLITVSPVLNPLIVLCCNKTLRRSLISLGRCHSAPDRSQIG